MSSSMSGGDLLAGRYELRGVLGRGGMAEVRDGWDTRLGRDVAIKLMHPTLTQERSARERFRDEARCAARLSHPHIVAVHDFGEHDGSQFIVMERLPGDSLEDWMNTGPLPVEWIRSILGDVLSALKVAHDAGLLHRDIKPANILMASNGRGAKLSDFGIAKTGQAAHTSAGLIMGTMSYLSPERVTGKPATPTDDLYAAGLTMYEALVGRRLYTQDNPAAVASAIMAGPPPPLATVRADVDPTLAAVIDRALAREFSSVDQMQAALHGAARPATRPLAEPLPPAPTDIYRAAPKRRFSRRTRIMMAAIAIPIALLVTVVALAQEPPASTVPRTESVAPVSSVAPVPVSVTTPSPSPSPSPSLAEQPVEDKPKPPKRPGNNGNGHGNGNQNGHGPGGDDD